VPWTDCDATVLLDTALIDLWHKDPTLINTNVYYSKHAWAYSQTLGSSIFAERFLQAREIKDKNSRSSGHVAVDIMIELGYTDIDVYGCDSWFASSVDSYTRKFIPMSSPNQEVRAAMQVKTWRVQWNLLMEKNRHVNINFMR
jgi:hypothetical protein